MTEACSDTQKLSQNEHGKSVGEEVAPRSGVPSSAVPGPAAARLVLFRRVDSDIAFLGRFVGFLVTDFLLAGSEHAGEVAFADARFIDFLFRTAGRTEQVADGDGEQIFADLGLRFDGGCGGRHSIGTQAAAIPRRVCGCASKSWVWERLGQGEEQATDCHRRRPRVVWASSGPSQ
jgi:hypothetical protein